MSAVHVGSACQQCMSAVPVNKSQRSNSIVCARSGNISVRYVTSLEMFRSSLSVSFFYLLSSVLFFSDSRRGGEWSTACVFKLHDKEVAKNTKGDLPVVLPVVSDPASSGLRNGTSFNRVFKNVMLLASGISPFNYSHSTDQMPRL